jgi:hypothetical protein
MSGSTTLSTTTAPAVRLSEGSSRRLRLLRLRRRLRQQHKFAGATALRLCLQLRQQHEFACGHRQFCYFVHYDFYYFVHYDVVYDCVSSTSL